MSSTQQLLLGEGAGGAAPVYIEDVFSTYLYTGTGAALTITNNIDLSTKGGLVWTKKRDGPLSHILFDTVRGADVALYSDLTSAQDAGFSPDYFGPFNSTGYGLSLNATQNQLNQSAGTYVSWTFRKQPKFFDVVTWTGNNAANRQISHSLGSVPGCIIVKRTDATSTWRVWHQNMVSNPANLYLNQLNLNTTDAVSLTYGEVWGTSNNVTSTTFQVGNLAAVNASGGTYVAYVFAHDAGGFGLTGTDNVISCGSFSANLNEVITLGYEPQWLLYKADDIDNWRIADNMRGLTNLPGTNAYTIQQLRPNSTGVEGENSGPVLTSTGFTWNQSGGGVTTIYIAIRRGPMKVPTLGTSVFSPNTYTGNNTTVSVSGLSFPPDLVIPKWRSDGGGGYASRPGTLYDRLRGATRELSPTSTSAESAQANGLTSFNQTGFTIGSSSVINSGPDPYISWNFRRAPSFFDEVCYTGNGSSPSRALNHNLNAVPELIIWKSRSNAANNWYVYNPTVGTGFYVELNTTIAKLAFDITGGNTPTSSVFNTCAGGDSSNNGNNVTYVAYLFATTAGVSKVGSYTGNGTTQTIDCGFTGGARFVLIKRIDAVGNWYTYDTARGMTVLTDPYLFMNSTAAEVATLGSVTTVSTGFALNSAILADINVSAGSYIFLAIA